MKKRFSKRTKFIITLLCAAGLTGSLFFIPTGDDVPRKPKITIPTFRQISREDARQWLDAHNITITSLEDVVKKGDFETLHYMLNAGWPIHDVGYYKSALHHAVGYENEAMCRYLLENGANVNTDNPLQLALMTGNLEIVRLLLEHKAAWEELLDPLHIALINDNMRDIRELCNKPEGAVQKYSFSYAYLGWTESPKVARMLIQAGANPKQVKQTTPLVFAAKRQNKKMLKLLLEHGADPNEPNMMGKTTMHYAAEFCSADIVDFLVSAGASVNVSNRIGLTPLHLAVKRGDPAIVKAFLKAGASVNAEDEQGRRPIHPAAAVGNAEIVELLLAADALCRLPDNKGNLPLHLACRSGNAATVALLLKAGADVNATNKRGQTPLLLAAQADSPETMELLLEAGANIDIVDNKKQGLADYALSHSKGKVLPLLFSKQVLDPKGSSPDNPNSSLLHYAAENGLPEMAAALLQAGANIQATDAYQDTPLHSAAFRNDAATIEILLKHGAQIDAPNKKGNTPLHYAVRREQLQAAKSLLQHKANRHAENNAGETPAILALENGNMELFSLMFDENADISQDMLQPMLSALAGTGNPKLAEFLEKKGHFKPDKATLLDAAEKGHVGLCAYMIEKGLDVNTANKEKQTLLILAAKNNHYDVIKLLLQKGANAYHSDAHGKNALAYTPNYRIRDLLEKHLYNATEAFFKMVAERSPQQVKEFCKKLPDVNITNHGGYNAVHVAAEKDRPHMINVLHQAGVNINHRNHSSLETPLMKAAWCNSRYAFDRLCKLGADLNVCNKDKSNALILATGQNHKYIVSQLIEHKADLNMQNRWSDSALILAITRRHADICNMLIKADGINPHLTADNKDTALHRAAKNGMNSQVLDLCRIGALAHVPNAQGELAIDLVQDADTKENVLKHIKRIPLHNFMYAAWNGDMKTLRRILKNRPKIVPRKDAMGFTALHLAAHNGQLEAVQFLCRAENQIHAKNKAGQSPLDFAKRGNHTEIIEYLETFDPQSVKFDDDDDKPKKKGKKKRK